jgi:arylsulfatase A-like enzyme
MKEQVLPTKRTGRSAAAAKALALMVFFTGHLLAPVSHADEVPARPNIIFILADDLGYGDLSCYPHESHVYTPNIDRLATAGVRMTQAYAAAPLCAPTRAAFLTGLFPQRVGVYENFDGEQPGIGPARASFPPLLQQAGYQTAWVGKWHQGWDLVNHPLNNGFDVAYGFFGGMHDYYNPAHGHHYNGGAHAQQAYVFDGFKPVKQMGYLTEELTARAVQFIRQKRTQPFFLYLPYNAPHSPPQAPDAALLQQLKKGLPPDEAVHRAMIDVLDAGVGQIMDTLKECGLEKNTLVMFMSDNGAGAGHNGGLRGAKGTMWEGGVRVPLMAAWPGTIPAGSRSDAVCCTPDVTATIMELAAVTHPTVGSDGVSLMPFWMGKRGGNAHDALVWSLLLGGPAGTPPSVDNLVHLGVRMGPWKVVRNQGEKVDALYNLDQDLGETKDLSSRHPGKKAELLAYGAELLKKCPPSSARIASRDTTQAGERQMSVDLAARCRKLLEQAGGK